MTKVDKMMTELQADTIREDGRLERHCKHGVGHTVGHVRGYLKGSWEGVHGCCACHADNWPCQEIRDSKEAGKQLACLPDGDHTE
jgi:hypothetical protein